MKKSLIIVGIIILFLVIIGFYCYSRDNIRFKLSYELVNKMELTNGKKIKVSIPINNRVKYLREAELIDFFKNGTGIIYMGYSTCPWCRNAIPVLIDTVLENDVDTLYYIDSHSISSKKVIKELYAILDEYLKVIDDGTKVLSVPDVYTVKNGTIVGHHRGCVEDYNNPYKGMNDKQIKELKAIYKEMIGAMNNG